MAWLLVIPLAVVASALLGLIPAVIVWWLLGYILPEFGHPAPGFILVWACLWLLMFIVNLLRKTGS